MEPVVGIGPVSRTTVDAALAVARRTRTPLMLIPSRRQVDAAEFGGGYLGWTTEEFAAYVRARDPQGLTTLCRDHGGPWMHTAEARLADPAEALDSCVRSFTADLDAGFGLLHIDTSEGRPGTGPVSARTAAARLVELYARCHAEATARGREVAYEIGFEPQDVSTNDPDEFKAALRLVLEGVEAAGAPLPRYVVAQTGTKVAELRNVGRFHDPQARCETLRQVSTLAAICHQEGVRLKAHNCDYLTTEETASLLRAGVDAFNVAPEYGVTETRALLRVLEEMELGAAKEDFLRLAHDSGKWRKWMLEATDATDVERAVIAGHYVFSTPEGLRIRDEAARALARRGRPPLETVLREAVSERIEAALHAVAAVPKAAGAVKAPEETGAAGAARDAGAAGAAGARR
ncbi:class II D-tagatose-bisphosphate aldolase, non-catalytic subunit [Streptomyces tubbatahanensis]|uniref:Class II D-tagatose-bisphosphate aldolase, non-catalytic subunit n=1 Tax=Streptomyces tubbatahanensis TaxID=2923272 RepID=A0ABY3Y052_9ACTN|nr:class II D-tagatose-bisphosphate aldolase, non-catalytic subunit [Streptomyces tubbatahanensis]UNT00183.1 class II D-tagatose-bisphosphate aldolase, non-catalytic subunit [Streptomyces tubbatahanensis]